MPNESVSKTLCSKHYQRLRLKGDVHAVSDHLSRTPEERFLSKVDKTDFCWLWNGAIEPTGYGRFFAQGTQHLAHKYSYEQVHGEVPRGMVVDHKYVSQGCPRHCVNPEHLQVRSYAQNADNFKGAKANNTSGHRNVSWNKNLGKWLVTSTTKGKRKHLGVFSLYELHVAGYVAREYRLTHKGLSE